MRNNPGRPRAAVVALCLVLLAPEIASAQTPPPVTERDRAFTRMTLGYGDLALTGGLLATHIALKIQADPDRDRGFTPSDFDASLRSGLRISHRGPQDRAATQLTIQTYELRWLTPKTRWIIPTTAYLLASTVGYLRIAADRHWTTDVLAGAATGTATSFLVYKLRTDWLL